MVILAKDGHINVGYIISSVDHDKVGEVDSLFVYQTYRGREIGDNLMKEALMWLDKRKVKKTITGVAACNEDAFKFYNRF